MKIMCLCDFDFYYANRGNNNPYNVVYAVVLTSGQKTPERLSVPVTKAEFAVMRTAFGVSSQTTTFFSPYHKLEPIPFYCKNDCSVIANYSFGKQLHNGSC